MTSAGNATEPSLWTQAATRLAETVKLLRGHAANLRRADPKSAEADRVDARANDLDLLGVEGELALARKWQEAQLEDWAAARQHDRNWMLKNTEQVIQLALSAIRSAVLVNGGALVALLAFLGNVWTKGWQVAEFARSFGWFATGLLAAIVTGACSYAAQFFYGHTDEHGHPSRAAKKVAPAFHVGALVLFIISLGAFGIGCYESFAVFNRNSPPAQELPMSDKNAPKPPVQPQRPPRDPVPFKRDQPTISPRPPTAPASPPMPFAPSKPAKPSK